MKEQKLNKELIKAYRELELAKPYGMGETMQEFLKRREKIRKIQDRIFELRKKGAIK